MRQTQVWMDVSLTKKSAHSIRRKSGPKSQINFNDTDDFNKYFIFNYHHQCERDMEEHCLRSSRVLYTPAAATLHFMRKMNHFIYECIQKRVKDFREITEKPQPNIIKHRSIATKQVHCLVSLDGCVNHMKNILYSIARQCRHLDKYKIHVNSDEYKFPFYFDCFFSDGEMLLLLWLWLPLENACEQPVCVHGMAVKN